MTRAGAMLLAATLAGLPAAGLPSGTSAKDLGVRGATWPVAELDLLEQVELQLLEMQRSGELARLETQARERVRRKLEEPDPVPGIAPATRERTRLFDPAIVVERDIRTPEGVLIAAAGTRIDPLTRMTLARDLLFVDGRRNPEIAWALAREIETGRPAKIVLLAGRPLDLMRRYRRPFFFDTGGRLAARFGLRFTPASVEQAGALLRISEIPVEDRDAPGSVARPGRDPGSGAGPNPERED